MGTELLTGFWLCQGYWPQTQEIWDIVPLDSSPEALLGIGHIQSKGCAEKTGEGALQGAPKSTQVRGGRATYSQKHAHTEKHICRHTPYVTFIIFPTLAYSYTYQKHTHSFPDTLHILYPCTCTHVYTHNHTFKHTFRHIHMYEYTCMHPA